jgi:hypothetical protein
MLELLGPPARDIESPVARNAEVHARDLTPMLEGNAAKGIAALRVIAVTLNERGC